MGSLEQSGPQRFFLRRWLNRLEIDRAVFYAIATRCWQFIAGPISILVIAACFTPELQGYFYTFASLMGMQTLVELGLHGVIINVSSHEWSRLHLNADGSIGGDDQALQRLAGLKQRVARWYSIVALIFFIGAGIGGALFLDQPRPVAVGAVAPAMENLPRVDWMPPWFCLVGLNGLLLWAWAYTAILEGCNQVVVVNRVRLMQFICGSFAVWCGMAAGFGLWVVVLSAAVRLVWDLWLIGIRYRRFWQTLNRDVPETALSWRDEVWPLQWRMAVNGIAGFLAYSLFTPVMYRYHGAVVAGQMGMTWTILTALESAAYAWVHARGPLFGMLAARRDWRELDRVYFRLTAISSGFYLLGIAGLCAGVWLLNVLPWTLTQRLASRMLPLAPTAILALAFLLLHLPRCQTLYIRAHKQDPFLISGLIVHGLIGALVVVMGRWAGPSGAAWSLLAVVGLIYIPWWTLIWSSRRRAWHAATAPMG